MGANVTTLVGLLVVRNEEWVLECSMRALAAACDALVVLDHASADHTPEIIARLADELPLPVECCRENDPVWREMEHRQRTLALGRDLGGTHFLLIDADEIISANAVTMIRERALALAPGDVLEVPWLCLWRSLDRYRHGDSSCWSRSWLTVAFADCPGATWRPQPDGYQHHSRLPQGLRPRHGLGQGTGSPFSHEAGGVMHLQFANRRRLVAKHVWYRMMEHLTYRGRASPDSLNATYDTALDERGLATRAVPRAWWEGVERDAIDLGAASWHETEIVRMLEEHGRERFAGLDLKGW